MRLTRGGGGGGCPPKYTPVFFFSFFNWRFTVFVTNSNLKCDNIMSPIDYILLIITLMMMIREFALKVYCTCSIALTTTSRCCHSEVFYVY